MTRETWEHSELQEFRRLDREIARMIVAFVGGKGFEDVVFVPTPDNLNGIKAQAESLLAEVTLLEDEFWRSHFTSVLESFLFKVKCDTVMPYAFLSRNSSILGAAVKQVNKPPAERLSTIEARLASVPAMLRALRELVPQCPPVGQSQVATTLPSFIADMKAAGRRVEELADSSGMKSAVASRLAEALAVAADIQASVHEVPVSQLEPVDIPFEESVAKGMQASLPYILEWVDDDVEMRRKEFFQMAKEIDPNRDPYDLLDNGSVKYSDAESLLRGMSDLLSHMQRDSRQFVDLPEGEVCEVIPTPDAYKMVCPTAMYMDASGDGDLKGYVCLNTDNLSAFNRGVLEETTAHEVYPGHHTHFVISGSRKLPHTFSISLPLSRCLIEGLAHRSEYLMRPYYIDPISRLDSARRGWYCSTRVKTEVDLYRNRRPVQEMLDRYVQKLACTAYSANGQMQAHLAYPADAISYYTGMHFLEDMYRESKLSQREFTNESFRYGNIALQTLRNVFSLSTAKRVVLANFREGSLTKG